MPETTPAAHPTIGDYTTAYRTGRTTPLEVARRLLDATARSEEHTPPLRLFLAQSRADVLEQAQRATERLTSGSTLGPLDGVPVAVKDELDQAGYPTTVGTTFLGREPVSVDATVVARLRAAGALLVGKVNMHEIGLGVTGINPHHGSARNPYDPSRVTGGSSSGSAAVVACGICPAALGADGGGSVRIPAALCGLSGIKPTFGRVSETGAAPLCWSVAHIGPLAGSLRDAALVLECIAGEDPADPNTLGQPPLRLDAIDRGVSGIRLGWCESWISQADPEVRRICRVALDRLVGSGANLVEIELEHLELVRPVQYVIIGTEMAASQYEHRREHRRDYGADTRVLLEAASRITAVDYIRAQRLRSQIASSFGQALRGVDVIVTPMTGRTAPPLNPAAEVAGESDEAVLDALTAFSFAANLTGLPALSVPVGYDGQGLPVGLQLIGRHWEEATIIRAGLAVERSLEWQAPPVSFDILPHR